MFTNHLFDGEGGGAKYPLLGISQKVETTALRHNPHNSLPQPTPQQSLSS